MNRKIKIALFLDSDNIPQWQYDIINEIQHSNYAEIALRIKNNSTNTTGESAASKLKNNWRYLLFILYLNLDKKIFKTNTTPFLSKNINDILGNVPEVKVTPIQKGFSDYFSDEDISLIKQHHIDVGYRMGFRILRGDILSFPQYGIWSYHHGDNKVNRGGPPAYWEVMKNEPITGATLQVLTNKLDDGIILGKTYNATEDKSVNRNKVSLYLNSKFLLLQKLRQLHKTNKLPTISKTDLSAYSTYLLKKPTNKLAFKHIFNLCYRVITSKLANIFYYNQWILLYSNKPYSFSANKFKKIIPPKDRFWADPFVMEHDNKSYIFFEELLYSNNKGHISFMTIDNKGNHSTPVKVIDEKYHLSYPFIMEYNGDIYMIPESAAGLKVSVYKCTTFPEKWTPIKNWFEGEKHYDTTIIFNNGLWYLFANKITSSGESSWNNLHIYYSEDWLNGNWQPHDMNPVVSDVRSSRPAGNIFEHNSKLYRPSQNSSKGYGYGLMFNEIIELTPNTYKEITIDKLLPEFDKNIIGVHTYNSSNKLTIIDAKYRRAKL